MSHTDETPKAPCAAICEECGKEITTTYRYVDQFGDSQFVCIECFRKLKEKRG